MAQETHAGRLIGGRYRLVGKLGQGGFGRVWQARDESLAVDVAVKEVWLPAAISAEEQSERVIRAVREARNAARLRHHSNIVAVYDVVVEDGVPWTVMQLVSGYSLAEYIAKYGPLSAEQAGIVAVATLNALEAAHAAGIIHRDVKPANIMLTLDSKALLTDFGIAVQQEDTKLTATGSFIGSIEYAAPERVRGNVSQPVSDLFSLGATLFYAVEGYSPFRRETSAGTMSAVLFDQPPQLVRAGALAAPIMSLLAKDPAARPSISQALEMFGAVASGAPVQERSRYSPPPGSAAAPALAPLPGPMSLPAPRTHTGPGVPLVATAGRIVLAGLFLAGVTATMFMPGLSSGTEPDFGDKGFDPGVSTFGVLASSLNGILLALAGICFGVLVVLSATLTQGSAGRPRRFGYLCLFAVLGISIYLVEHVLEVLNSSEQGHNGFGEGLIAFFALDIVALVAYIRREATTRPRQSSNSA